MRIIFMGTPDFAVGALESIIKAGHQVVLVVTQPDKPKGRGKEMQVTPIKECALRCQIPVFQPVKIKTEEAIDELRKYQADLFVVAAFGQILSQAILDMPPFGCVNIHASLLPKFRGAAPIQWSILMGEQETGITIMQMDVGLDTGDMLAKAVVPIEKWETGESLHDKLKDVGAKLIVETLPKIEKGELKPEKQRDEDSCYAKMLTKSLGNILWEQPAENIERLIRGLNSWPSAYTTFRGKTMKIWEAKVSSSLQEGETAVGSIVFVGKDSFGVKTGDGILEITSIQLEGKKRMAVKEFLLGYPLQTGEVLGEASH